MADQLAERVARLGGDPPAAPQVARDYDDPAAGLAFHNLGPRANTSQRQRDRRLAIDYRMFAAEDELGWRAGYSCGHDVAFPPAGIQRHERNTAQERNGYTDGSAIAPINSTALVCVS